MARNDLQGTLDLLILKTLSQVLSLHGYGIVQHIQRASNELLSVKRRLDSEFIRPEQQLESNFGIEVDG